MIKANQLLIFAIVVPLCFPLFSQTSDTSCLVLDAPKQGNTISSPTCTVSVHACNKISGIQFRAQYRSPGKLTDTTIFIGSIANPPFKFSWNIEQMPNVLYQGITLTAEAMNKNGSRQTVNKQGIFFAHRPIIRPLTFIQFGSESGAQLFSQSRSSDRFPATIQAFSYYDRSNIHFTIKTMVAITFSTQPAAALSEWGVDIGIDTRLNHQAYPSDSILFLSFSLNGNSEQTIFKPLCDPDGAFTITKQKKSIQCPFDLIKDDGKGFTMDIDVPKDLLGNIVPDSFACNVIVKLPGDSFSVAAVSWANALGNNAYCPIVWSTVRLRPAPFYHIYIFQWLLAFAAGILCIALIGLVIFLINKRATTFEQFEQTEEEKKLTDQIYQYLEETITKKEISLVWLAQKLNIPPKKIEWLLKKFKGKSFKDYAMVLRIEIAKERLRSSHASEKSISDSCGFKNVSEMEKYFVKFCRTTPYKFRKENQVA